MNLKVRIKLLNKFQQMKRLNILRKIAVDLMEFTLNNTEQKICNLLLAVVDAKSPDTVLRIAGGFVRDKLLGKTSHDIDISLNNMSGEQFANLVLEYMEENNIKHKGGVSVVKANPGQSKHLATAMVNIFGYPIDFVNLRKETYANSRIPTVEPGTPQEDAERRDLTINSLFYNINTGEIEDYVGGLEDLKNGIARTPIDPVQTFIDDPLRILRTIRFASKYNLDIEPSVIEAANNQEVKDAFKSKVSLERVWKELGGQEEPEGWKEGFLSGPNPHRAAHLLGEMGLRDIVFGLDEAEQKELGLEKGMISFDSEQYTPHHDLNIWNHTLKVLEHLVKYETPDELKQKAEDYLVRNLSALLHDVGKCDLCAIQMFPPDHPEYKARIKKLLEKYNLQHEGELRTYEEHAKSSAKIADHLLNRLKAPRHISKRVVKLVENHMRPHGMDSDISDKALRTFIKDLEKDWRNSLDLAIADAHGKSSVDSETRKKYDKIIERIDELISKMGGDTKVKSPISGKDLLEAGFKSGPTVGAALKALHEKLLEHPNMTKEEALLFVNKFK